MAAEDIENKVRKMSSQKPEDGKDLQQLQEAQNQIVQINAERQRNLQTARLENNANAANNETMSQAVEMASLGGLGGAAVQQQVQAMNPQTQAVLGKYGLGQPRVQRSSSRNVQVTPQKITINNNTTNTTTNNVAVPAANIGGPVQGRSLAIKQDESQARFKTWISNAFAKQNQQAAVREKEYQRREWSLTRSTSKLMKHLSDLGKSVSERLNPQKLASSVGNQFRTILFLFGTTFLAKNWEKVISIGASIERFFFGEVTSRDKNGKVVSRGDSELGKFLKKLFGGQESETVGDAFRKLFWNPSGEGGVGIFDLLLKKINKFFEVRGAALEAIKPPSSFDSMDDNALGGLAGFFKDAIGYLGNILKIMIAGPKAAKEFISKKIKTRARSESFEEEDGRVGHENRVGYIASNDWNEKGSNRRTAHMGLSGSVLGERNYITREDFDSNGDLNLNVGSTTAQLRNIDRFKSLASTEGKVGVAQVVQGYKDLKNAAIKNEGRIPLRSGYVYTSLKEGDSKRGDQQIKNFISSGDIINKDYRVVIRPRTRDEIGANSISPKLAAAISYASDKAIESMGGGGAEKHIKDALFQRTTSGRYKSWVKNATRAGWQTISWIPGIPNSDVAMAYAEYVDAKDLRENLEDHEILDIVPKEVIDKGLPDGWSLPKNKSLLEPIPVSEVTPRVIDQMVKNYTGNDLFNADTDSIEYFAAVQKKLEDAAKKSGKEISYIEDFNYIESYNKLSKLAERERELDEDFNKAYLGSRPYKSGKYISEGVSSAIDSARNYLGLERKYPSLTKDQGEFIRKMREAYSKRFKELGIDEKYIDALVAQDAIESEWGTSDLATKSNNFGGLKNGNKGWQKFNSLEDYINSKVDLLRNENGYYKNAFNGDDIDTMMNRVASVYDPKNNKYAGTWKDVYNSVSRYNPLSTEEIKSLRNQGKYAEADLASSSWEKIEDILRAGGVTDFIAGKTKREAGEAGNSGNNSYHTTENLALDIVPTDGNFERLKQQMLSSPLIQEYFKKRGLGVLDETTDEMLKKTGGTGYHFHIGPDRSSVDTWLAWNKEFNSNNSNEGGVYYADNYVEERKPESNYLSQLVLDEKSYNPEFSIPSFNSPFLASTSFTTPNSATKVPTIDTPMISAKTIGKEITSSNNDSATISDILKTTNLLNDNIKLLQQGQLAQVQATTSIASGLGNMTITVNSGGDKKIPTAGWTKEPYA